jgi:ABC-type branched-subunit amino acid transport system ATPase component
LTVLDTARVAAHSGSGRRVVEHDAHVREVREVCGLAEKAHRLAGALPLLDLKRLEVAASDHEPGI